MTPICSPGAAPLPAPLLLCNEKVFVVTERGVNCQGNYKLALKKKKERRCYFEPSLILQDRVSEENVCLPRWAINFHQGGGGRRGLMHLHSTPVLNHQMARYYLCACAPPLTLGMLHFLSPPRWVTDGFSCRRTITAAAFGCIPFVLVGVKQNGHMEMVMFYACCFVCLVACCSHEKRIFTRLIHGQPIRRSQTVVQRNLAVFLSVLLCFI